MMGRHKEWRAQAKKMRRKKIRQLKAQERDSLLEEERKMQENSPRHQAWEQEQQVLEEFEREEEERLNWERNVQWARDEEVAQRQWRERQAKLALAREENTKQELRIREEWELEQNKLRVAEEIESKKKEEKQRQQDELLKQIDDFINKGKDLPISLTVTNETNPNKPLCPFFSKTGACRFGDRCSRNHPRPGVSKVLLIPGFYSHFGIQNFLQDEYDTDIMLEYEDSETYQHFKEFFDDVLLEFERFGRVVQFKVCRNFEPHLRGNVYVEYASTQDAVAAFQKFQGRWYGGRQLNVEFTSVPSWRNAICGLFFKARCPKGKGCNFLHVFRNPNNAFANADLDHGSSWRKKWNRSRSKSPSRSPRARNKNTPNNWRWSESPERRAPQGTRIQIGKVGVTGTIILQVTGVVLIQPGKAPPNPGIILCQCFRTEVRGERVKERGKKKGNKDKDPNIHRKEKTRKHSHSCTRSKES